MPMVILLFLNSGRNIEHIIEALKTKNSKASTVIKFVLINSNNLFIKINNAYTNSSQTHMF